MPAIKTAPPGSGEELSMTQGHSSVDLTVERALDHVGIVTRLSFFHRKENKATQNGDLILFHCIQ